MVFHRAFLPHLLGKTKKIIVRNNKLAAVKSTIFLGGIIDDKLKWKEHLHSTVHKKLKFQKSIKIFYKIKPYS